MVRVAPAPGGRRLSGRGGQTRDAADAYDVLSPDGSALRGTFVIDPQGILRQGDEVLKAA